MENSARPIIIIKKKAGHGGHHGGAWKVAYADFVTAMMALFIVLWLLNTSKPVREAIAGYFRDLSGTANKMGSKNVGAGENFRLKHQIEMTITSEGLRIEMMETESGTFFDVGSPRPNSNGKELLVLLAQELGKVPNRISIEGHTDSRPFTKRGDYGNWELSVDRANAARPLMQQNGVRPDQISQVRGFADHMLRKSNDPQDPSNRRISLIVQYINKDQQQPENASAGEAKAPDAAPKER
jgi:chemotaxis protein MotB